VVIRLDTIYHYDTSALTPQDLAVFQAGFTAASYSYADYKSHVLSTLQQSFGTADVKAGKKAIKIRANGGRRSADVVVATEFRRYYSGLFGPQYERGISFFNSNGLRIDNYPKQHSANCTTKHQATNGWFKPMVRIFKNMRGKLVDDGAIEQGTTPSYFLEGLLFNVPDDKLGKNYGDSFVAAFNWIVQAKRADFVCANKQHYLVRDSAATCWPCADYDRFLNAAAKLWTNWT
jgi:hypothetical protein